jgi:hypothetical protein
MTEIVCFQALAFDLVDGRLADSQLVDCKNPAAAVQTAQGQWKFFGYAGAVALSRTSFIGEARAGHKLVLRRFGQVPEEYLTENIDE